MLCSLIIFIIYTIIEIMNLENYRFQQRHENSRRGQVEKSVYRFMLRQSLN